MGDFLRLLPATGTSPNLCAVDLLNDASGTDVPGAGTAEILYQLVRMELFLLRVTKL